MATVDVKLGNNTYNNISTINVDKVGGGSANFIYEENKNRPLVILTNTTTPQKFNSISGKTILNTSIELEV